MSGVGRAVRARGTSERILSSPLAQRTCSPRAFVDRGVSHRISVRRWLPHGTAQIREYQADRESVHAPDSSVPAAPTLRGPPAIIGWQTSPEERALNRNLTRSFHIRGEPLGRLLECSKLQMYLMLHLIPQARRAPLLLRGFNGRGWAHSI